MAARSGLRTSRLPRRTSRLQDGLQDYQDLKLRTTVYALSCETETYVRVNPTKHVKAEMSSGQTIY